MNNYKENMLWGVLLALICLITLVMISCTTSKNISTDQQQYSKEEQLRDSVKMLTIDNERLEAEKRENQYYRVDFIRDTVNHHDTITNTIEISKDGGVRATGNILSAYVAKSVLTKVLEQKNRTIDSLRLLTNKVETKYYTITKTRTIKRSFIPIWIWLIIAGLVAYHFRKQIKTMI